MQLSWNGMRAGMRTVLMRTVLMRMALTRTAGNAAPCLLRIS